MASDKQFNKFNSDFAIIFYLFCVKILIHLIHPEYGFHRDEYFYMAIADQFSFQNLDMLPLTPLFLKAFMFIFGNSIKALHFASGLLGAFTLFFMLLIVKELGGKKYAITLAGIFYLLSGILIFGAIFTYDSLDFLIWVSAIYILVRLFKEENPRLWIALGVVLGLGLMNKMTILFLGLAVFVCLWFVPQRKFFKEKWIWIAGIIALTYSLPFVYWQILNDWYFLDFAASYSGGIAARYNFLEYIWGQILPNNIFTLPVWGLGLGLLLFSPKWKIYRFFGYVYVFLFFTFYFAGAKFYFLIPAYSILIAVGSIRIEQWIEAKKLKKTQFVIPIAYVILSLPFLPMIMPVLPVEKLVHYVSLMGIDAGVRTETRELNNLPQHMADRFGWEEMVQQLAVIYHSEPNYQDIGILAANWGQASAIHYYRDKYDLPEPITEHGWYYFNTLNNHQFKESYISVEATKPELQAGFKIVEERGIFTHPYVMPDENNKLFYFCTGPKYNFRQYWIVQRHMDPQFEKTLNDNGIDAAIAYYRKASAADSMIMLFSENQMNALGYQYLFSGQIDDAIKIFKLNVEANPYSWNVYDSLAEGYMRNGQYDLAIDFYNKSIEINPENTNGIDMLKSIEKIRNDKNDSAE